jgi:hypothetical protein
MYEQVEVILIRAVNEVSRSDGGFSTKAAVRVAEADLFNRMAKQMARNTTTGKVNEKAARKYRRDLTNIPVEAKKVFNKGLHEYLADLKLTTTRRLKKTFERGMADPKVRDIQMRFQFLDDQLAYDPENPDDRKAYRDLNYMEKQLAVQVLQRMADNNLGMITALDQIENTNPDWANPHKRHWTIGQLIGIDDPPSK